MSNFEGSGAICLKGSVDIVCEFFEYGINSILYQRGLYPADSFIQQEKYGLPLLITSNDGLKRYLDVVLNQLRAFLETKNVHKIVVVIIKIETMETVERWQFDVDLEKPNQYYDPYYDQTSDAQASSSHSQNNNRHQQHHLQQNQQQYHQLEAGSPHQHQMLPPPPLPPLPPNPVLNQQQQLLPIQPIQSIQPMQPDETSLLKEIQDSIKGVVRQITASVTFLPMLEGSHSFDILLYTDKDVDLPNSEWSDTNARLINNGEHVQLRSFTTHVHRVSPFVSYRQ